MLDFRPTLSRKQTIRMLLITLFLTSACSRKSNNGVSDSIITRLASGEDFRTASGFNVSLDAGDLQLKPNLSTIPTVAFSALSTQLVDSDFENFDPNEFVYDASQEPLRLVNNLLCIYFNADYHLHANTGPFLAKVPLNSCLHQSRDKGIPGIESTSPALENALVVSTKEDGKPLHASIWFIRDDLLGTGYLKHQVYAQLTIAESMGPGNPYGIFSLKWAAFGLQGRTESDVPSQFGYLDVGLQDDRAVQLRLRSTNFGPGYAPSQDGPRGDWSHTQYAVALLTMNHRKGKSNKVLGGLAVTGNLTVSSSSTEEEAKRNGQRYGIGFDGSHAVVKFRKPDDDMYPYPTGFDPEAPRCLDRFENYADISYALFDAAGNRVHHQRQFHVLTEQLRYGAPYIGDIDASGLYIDGLSDGDSVQLLLSNGDLKPYTYRKLYGILRDDFKHVVTIPSNIVLVCSSQCLKPNISAADIANGAIHLPGAATYTYEFATRRLFYGSDPVRLEAGVTNNEPYIMSLSADSKTYTWDIPPTDRNPAAALVAADGSFFSVFPPISFQPFTYHDASDAYPSNRAPSMDGHVFDLSFNGFVLDGIPSIDTGARTQQGDPEFAQQVSLKKGVVLTVAQSTGSVSEGDKIRLAPNTIILRPKETIGCSNTASQLATFALENFPIPPAMDAVAQNVKLFIGPRPETSEDGSELKVKVINGISQQGGSL